MTPKLVTRPAPGLPAGLAVSSQGVESYLNGLWTYVILGALSTTMLGIFTILVFFATIVLIRKGLRRRATLILLGAMYVMYASTVAYWVILVLGAIGYYHAAQAYWSQFHCQCLASSIWNVALPGTSVQDICTHLEYGLSGLMHALTTCVPTIILTVNVLLGDAIVWWRVLAIWPDSLIVKSACIILLQSTFSMGLFDINDSCPTNVFTDLTLANLSVVPSGTMFEQDLYGLTASVLSLASNLVATTLVWCKAWEHRKLIASVSLGRSSTVEKVLALLVESGAVYSILWMGIVAYQVVWQVRDGDISPHLEAYLDYFMKGCLIPLVGMYPTAIILIVALNKSHFEGTTRGDIVTPHISFRRPTSTYDSSGNTVEERSTRSAGWPKQAQAHWDSLESTVLARSKHASADARDEEASAAAVGPVDKRDSLTSIPWLGNFPFESSHSL